MIFVTVGSQFPFDRLIEYFLEIIPKLNDDIVFQIGKGKKPNTSYKVYRFLSMSKHQDILNAADYIVSADGMGTIIQGLSMNKKIICLQRMTSLNENRILSTRSAASFFHDRGHLYLAKNKEDFQMTILNRAKLEFNFKTPRPSENLTNFLQSVSSKP